MKIATIDIGTHSVLLLALELSANGALQKIADEATLTRIGEGMASHSVFLESGMERTLSLLKKYKDICSKFNIHEIHAVGTAAFRKAKNASTFVEKVKQECGIAIQIIPGTKEAELTWSAAATDFGSDIMVVDIGGGSTEIIIHKPENAVSIPVGSVLLTEQLIHTDPVSSDEYQALCNRIASEVQKVSLETGERPSKLVATAGTATTLGAMHKKMESYRHDEIHGMQLSLADIHNIREELRNKTIAERKKIAGLEPGRADVIFAGSILLETIAKHFGLETITVSDRGVRWGLAYEALAKHGWKSGPKSN